MLPPDWFKTGPGAVTAIADMTGYGTQPSPSITQAMRIKTTTGNVTYVEFTLVFDTLGSISFYDSISSESSYDNGYFYIDGASQYNLSGSQSWTLRTYAVSAGSHTFRWAYSKDSSADVGQDAYVVARMTTTGSPVPGSDVWTVMSTGATGPTGPTGPSGGPTGPTGRAVSLARPARPVPLGAQVRQVRQGRRADRHHRVGEDGDRVTQCRPVHPA